jgi:hypothetical protein
VRPEDFPPGFAVPERQAAGVKTCLAFMTARRARDVEAWNGLVRSLSGEEAADAFIVAVAMLEAVGTRRAYQATHACRLPDPCDYLFDSLIECEECQETWRRRRRFWTRRPYWSGLRYSLHTDGLVFWHSEGGAPRRRRPFRTPAERPPLEA